MSLSGIFVEDGTITGEAHRVDLEVYGDNVPFVDVKDSLDRALENIT